MLHGSTQDVAQFAAGTRMNELAARDGFAVLYCEQAKTHNKQSSWKRRKHNHQVCVKGEMAILAGMVRMREQSDSGAAFNLAQMAHQGVREFPWPRWASCPWPWSSSPA